jgi:cytochrome c oxidase assembly protein subunit 15
LTLAIWLHRSEERRWVRRLGLAAVAAIAAQALLGGITVLLRLPVPVSVAHACLAQGVLALTVTIAVVTSPSWIRAGSPAAHASASRPGAIPPGLERLAAAATAAIYLQLILGALVRHTGSGLAIPDFPLAFGRLIPPLTSPGIAIHFAHRLGAMVVAALVIATAVRIIRDCRGERALLIPGVLLIPLLATQILLGAFTVWSGLAVAPATAHVATGAVLLATSLVVALMSHRLLDLTAPEPTLAPIGVRAVTS